MFIRHQTEEKDLGAVKQGGNMGTCPIRNAIFFVDTVCPKENYPVEVTARIPFLFIAPLNNPPRLCNQEVFCFFLRLSHWVRVRVMSYMYIYDILTRPTESNKVRGKMCFNEVFPFTQRVV